MYTLSRCCRVLSCASGELNTEESTQEAAISILERYAFVLAIAETLPHHVQMSVQSSMLHRGCSLNREEVMEQRVEQLEVAVM